MIRTVESVHEDACANKGDAQKSSQQTILFIVFDLSDTGLQISGLRMDVCFN